jgi:hypothetical protein
LKRKAYLFFSKRNKRSKRRRKRKVTDFKFKFKIITTTTTKVKVIIKRSVIVASIYLFYFVGGHNEMREEEMR